MTFSLELLALLGLILLNAFFVAAEYGLVTARRTRIIELQHQGNRRARDVLRITSDPPRFIAAMQLGVTLTSLGIGALGEATLSREFDKFLVFGGEIGKRSFICATNYRHHDSVLGFNRNTDVDRV